MKASRKAWEAHNVPTNLLRVDLQHIEEIQHRAVLGVDRVVEREAAQKV